MKVNNSIAIAGAVCCFLAGTLALAAENTTEDEALIAAEVQKMFKVTSVATKLDSPALKKVTDAAIYDVKVTVKGPDSSSTTSTIRMMKGAGGIVALKSPTTNESTPWLMDLIKKDFKLKTNEDAKTVEDALDVLYPISDSFGGKDLKAKAIKREDGQVTFIRGEFFDHLKGFIFEIDEKGTISKVHYSLKLDQE